MARFLTATALPVGQRGFGLVEALAAGLVLCASLVLTARHQALLARHAEAVRHQSEALRLAESELEQLRARPALLASEPLRSWWVDSASADGTRYALARQAYPDRVADLHAVRVTVAWTDRSGTPRQLELQTGIAAADAAHGGALELARGAAPPGDPRASARSAEVSAPPVPATESDRP